MSQEIEYWCAFCDKREKVEAPTTFRTHYGHDVEDAACPDHAGAMEFLGDQCPGCVGGWGDCQMFTLVGNRSVSPDDLTTIRSGICPHRVNGTSSFGPGGFTAINLSKKSRYGGAFADAICDLQADV